MNLANKLTVFRMILVPFIMIVPLFKIEGNLWGIPIAYLLIDLIFIIASITDKLDGYIARSKNQITVFGKFLDPIADKILVLTAMIILVEYGKLPSWIPVIVLAREFLVSGFRLVAAQQEGKVIAASVWGKIKTVTQMVGIIAAYIDINTFGAFLSFNLNSGWAYFINIFQTVMIFVSVIATIFSGWDYMKGGKHLLKDM